MKIVIGLGNPGSQYERTRHNVGFDTLRVLAEQAGAETPKKKFESYVAEGMLPGRVLPGGGEETAASGPQRLLLVWPQTYMNRSGLAVRQAASFYKVPLEDWLVICDDFHLPVGRLRLKTRGSAGGQNGLRDIAQQMGTEEYHRLRIGVGPLPAGRDAADFVLGRFSSREREEADLAVHDAAAAAACWALHGATEAMNHFNAAS